MGENKGRSIEDMYKGHMDQAKGSKLKGERWD